MSRPTGAEAPVRAPLRVGLVGCGDISPMHLDAITGNADAVLVAVADRDADTASAAAARYGVRAYQGLTEMLSREQPDVVHVCTPHHLHAPMAVEALQAGVHVLLEKPVATTVADAERIAVAADNGPGMLGVCFQNRYNATSRRIRELLDSGATGAILGGRASVTWSRDAAYYARRPWRGRWAEAGGGVLINQAIHTLDLLQWYLGDVEQVRGQASQLALDGLIEVEDTAVIRLTHAGGVGSIFYATNGYSDNSPAALEIRTERALLRLAGDLTISWLHGPTEVVTETQVGGGEHAYWGDAHKLLIADFYQHVRSDQRFWIGAAEATASLRILTAVYAQSGVGRQTVA